MHAIFRAIQYRAMSLLAVQRCVIDFRAVFYPLLNLFAVIAAPYIPHNKNMFFAS